MKYICIYHDAMVTQVARFDCIDDYKNWVDSGMEYGIRWAHLIEVATGKIVECDFAEV
mgnify:CR=1 FL=1